MRTVLSRSAHADQLEAEVRDATCCVVTDRCWSCEIKLEEVRAIGGTRCCTRSARSGRRRAVR